MSEELTMTGLEFIEEVNKLVFYDKPFDVSQPGMNNATRFDFALQILQEWQAAVKEQPEIVRRLIHAENRLAEYVNIIFELYTFLHPAKLLAGLKPEELGDYLHILKLAVNKVKYDHEESKARIAEFTKAFEETRDERNRLENQLYNVRCENDELRSTIEELEAGISKKVKECNDALIFKEATNRTLKGLFEKSCDIVTKFHLEEVKREVAAANNATLSASASDSERGHPAASDFDSDHDHDSNE